MSLLDSMYIGVSGLDAESGALSVIGNNVSNMNTVGFKESRALFENVMGSAAGNPMAVGDGVYMAGAQQVFTQGSLEQTGNPTDVALSGDGFFVVQGSVGGVNGQFYTRAGQASLSSDGTLVNPQGMAFQGYTMQANGTLSSQVGPLTISTSALAPKATSTVNVSANLDPTTPANTGTFDPTNPSATCISTSTPVTVYDSLGNAHNLSVYYQNDGGNTWTYHVVDPAGAESGNPNPGKPYELQTGTLTFNSTGALQSNTVSLGPNVTFTGGANPQSLNFNLGTPIGSGGAGTDGITQYAAGGNQGTGSSQGAISQDGYASGSLSGVQIGPDGTVSGVYSNGQTISVGQLAVAKFQSDTGLSNAGQNVWAATGQSGAASVGAAGSGGRGSLVTGALEQSNVDISAQFVDLIAHQQGYQANSKTIQTADQMLTTLMQNL